MGAYCVRALIPSHAASVGEIMAVLWSDYYGAVIFGDRREIACIPHTGCRLEILATAPTSHRALTLLLPGQVLRYKRSFFLGDRFELPGGTTVSLRHLVGFKLQLIQRVTSPSAAVGRPRSEPERVTVSETHEPLTTQLMTAGRTARLSDRAAETRDPDSRPTG